MFSRNLSLALILILFCSMASAFWPFTTQKIFIMNNDGNRYYINTDSNVSRVIAGTGIDVNSEVGDVNVSLDLSFTDARYATNSDLNQNFVPYVGADSNVDLGDYTIEANWSSKIGGVAQYFEVIPFDAGVLGVYPMIRMISDGLLGNLGAIQDALIIAGVNGDPSLVFSNSTGFVNDSITYHTATGVFEFSDDVDLGSNDLLTTGDLDDGSVTISVAEAEDAYGKRVDTWTSPLQFNANVASIDVNAMKADLNLGDYATNYFLADGTRAMTGDLNGNGNNIIDFNSITADYFSGDFCIDGNCITDWQDLNESSDLNSYVPYSGATNNVDLGDKNFTTTDEISADHYDISGSDGLVFQSLGDKWLASFAAGLGADNTGLFFNSVSSLVEWKYVGFTPWAMDVATGSIAHGIARDVAMTYAPRGTNTGAWSWMEDENYFKFYNDVWVSKGSSGATANANASAFVIEDNATNGLTILTPNTVAGRIYFGDSEEDNAGRIIYDHASANPEMRFITEGVEKLTMHGAATVFNENGGDIRFRVESAAGPTSMDMDGGTGNVGLGATASTAYHFSVIDTTVDTAEVYGGMDSNWTKTAGATDYADSMYGIRNNTTLNQSGGVVGNWFGNYNVMSLNDGEIGAIGNTRDLYGNYNLIDINDGNVTDDVFGFFVNMDQEAANTITGDAYAAYLKADFDGTVTGTSHLLYLDGTGTGIDYGIYQAGTSTNELSGITKFGDKTTNYAQFATDGKLTLFGTAMVKKLITLTAQDWHASSLSHNLVGTVNTYAFISGADKELYYNLCCPDDMKAGEDMTLTVDWVYTGAQDNGTVSWNLEYINIATGETVAGTTATITETTAGTHPTGKLIKTTFTSKLEYAVARDIIGLRLYRDVSEDTLGVDAEMVATHFEYTANKLGKAT